MRRVLRRASLALAVLLPLAGCAPAWSDPPAQPKPPPAPANRDGIDDLIGAAGGQKSGEPKRPADGKDDPADLLKGLDDPGTSPRKANPGQTGPDAPEPPAPKAAPKKTGLPKYYDRLDLTQDQIDKIHKVSEKYDGPITELQRRLDRLRETPIPRGSGATLLLIARIKKLTAQRHEALMDILTEQQQQKLKECYAAERK